MILFAGITLIINQGMVGFANNPDLQKARDKRVAIQEKMIAKSNRAQELQLMMDQCQVKVEEIQKEVEPLEKEYRKALDQWKEVDEVFKKRIVRMYKNGETGYLACLLTAPSIQEFLRRLMLVRLITKQDFHVMYNLKVAALKVENRKKAYDDRIKEQMKYIEQAQKAYLRLQEGLNEDRKGLDAVQCIEEAHQDELIKINLKEWTSGKLRFPYVQQMIYPTSGTRETSGYGPRRQPISGGTRWHEGLDFAGPIGTPVYAPADGVVVSSKASGGYGWLITIYHGEYKGKSVFTRYAHSYPRQVQIVVGQQVYAGKTQLTSIGNLGFSTGPHLHFEVRYGHGDNPPSDNPKNWLRKKGIPNLNTNRPRPAPSRRIA